MDNVIRQIGVKANCRIVIRKYGNYINTVENTQEALKRWLVRNMPPTAETPTDTTGCKITDQIGFACLTNAAIKSGFTFELIKNPTK